MDWLWKCCKTTTIYKRKQDRVNLDRLVVQRAKGIKKMSILMILDNRVVHRVLRCRATLVCLIENVLKWVSNCGGMFPRRWKTRFGIRLNWHLMWMINGKKDAWSQQIRSGINEKHIFTTNILCPLRTSLTCFIALHLIVVFLQKIGRISLWVVLVSNFRKQVKSKRSDKGRIYTLIMFHIEDMPACGR